MSQEGQGPAPPVDEARVEKDLRDILFRLDRALERYGGPNGVALGLIGGVGFVVCFPVGLYLAIWVWGWPWPHAVAATFIVSLMGPLLVGFGACAALEALSLGRAVRRFNEAFPEGGAERAAALRALGEMKSPRGAPRKLRKAVAASSPSERIVRRPAEASPAPSDGGA
jgi:hypothetical protein